ncbi:type II toxin-antitoxin system VapC family toxin [Embleya sp. NPDC050493]|uniref:type II toxin-antitoxin system VapC family toxin n=1 Tax=Embleya sp. NPDC050493 TaxID=3363989 RepID=UPI00379C200C
MDSSIYLDLIVHSAELQSDTGEERWRAAKTVFDAIDRQQIRLAGSSLIHAEVCCNGHARVRAKRSGNVAKRLVEWFESPDHAWTEIDDFIAQDAVRLSAEHHTKSERGKRFNSADVLHLACAIRLGCDYLMTQDGGFPVGHKIDGVQVIRPRVVWQETLEEASAE